MSSFRLSARRLLCAGALVAGVLAVVPTAGAYEGDWIVEGEFARTTTPSFSGGFNPNDVDYVAVRFDNRAKELAVQLDFFEVPSRGNVYLSLGTGRFDGTCDAGALDLAVIAKDHIGQTTETIQVPYWVGGETQYATTWAPYGPGPGWEYVGYSSWTGLYKWKRYTPGHYEYREETRTTTGVSSTEHERVATLERDGVNGDLTDTDVVDNDERQLQWTFAHPLLSDVAANCIEIHVPGRNAPFVLSPPAVPAPTPTPTPTPETPIADDGTIEELDFDEVTTTARRRSGRIELRMVGGDATQMQIKVRRTTKTVDFRRRVLLRGSSATAKAVSVRFSDGADWSEWERIVVR